MCFAENFPLLYCCKDYKTLQGTRTFFFRFFVCFWGFVSSLLKYKFFKLEARKFHFPKYKFFSEWVFFIFRAQKITSLNIRSFLEFLFHEIKGIFLAFLFPEIWEKLLRKYKKPLNIRARKCHFLKYKI